MEPFGYFKAEPFGWTDCSEDDEGAVALYEHPHQDIVRDAAIGKVVWKFIDRMDDVADCDPADKILAEFVAAVMPHINEALKGENDERTN